MGITAGRKGGRPREIEKPLNVGFLIAGETNERLEIVAKEIGISKAQLIRNLVETGLEEVECMRAAGLLAAVRWTRTLRGRLREKRAEVESQVESSA